MNQFFQKIAKANYTTLRSDLNEFQQQIMDNRTKKMVTIQNEVLRSQQEVEIANFLYLNGIDYVYEPIYPYHILLSRKPYTPDFMIEQMGERHILSILALQRMGKTIYTAKVNWSAIRKL